MMEDYIERDNGILEDYGQGKIQEVQRSRDCRQSTIDEEGGRPLVERWQQRKRRGRDPEEK